MAGCEEGCDGRCGDEVVSAGVADVREGVVLGAEDDLTTALAGGCFKGRF